VVDKRKAWNLAYWLIALLVLVLLQNFWPGASRIHPVSPSEFELALREGQVQPASP